MHKIVIADDHPFFRKGLRALIEKSRRHKVVGEAADGFEAIRLARELKPHIMVMDIGMPVLDGLAASRRILALSSHIRIIIISIYDDSAMVGKAIRLGVFGYVLKSRAPREVEEAVRSVSLGRRYFSPALVPMLRELKRSGGECVPIVEGI
jgi:DNA-binding NarL/FixJ family response regulator